MNISPSLIQKVTTSSILPPEQEHTRNDSIMGMSMYGYLGKGQTYSLLKEKKDMGSATRLLEDILIVTPMPEKYYLVKTSKNSHLIGL